MHVLRMVPRIIYFGAQINTWGRSGTRPELLNNQNSLWRRSGTGQTYYGLIAWFMNSQR
jgi:antibiotic biosynthesis monooxygenase (ABM) superfamily enzyme